MSRLVLPIIISASCFMMMGCQSDRSDHQTQADSPNILFISVDTLRADHLGLYGYSRKTSPLIDEFFSKGTIFEQAYATSSKTSPSVLSFLTGLIPQNHGTRCLYQKIPPDTVTLSRALQGQGYQTSGIVANIVLTREASDLHTQFEYYDDFVNEKEPYRIVYERGAKPNTDAALKWLYSVREAQRPFFLWVHYIDPHGPYHPPDSKPVDFTHHKTQVIDPNRIPKYIREPGINDGLEYIDRYDEEIAYTDAEIGRLLQALTQLQLVDNTLFIFTADHGECMMDHERWFRHGYHVYEELMHVPLAIRGRPFATKRISDPVSIVDIMPTFLEVLGVSVPPDLDGISLLRPVPSRYLFMESIFIPKQWRAIRRGHEKWVVRYDRSQKEELAGQYYNLLRDPTEKHPESWSQHQDEATTKLRTLLSQDHDLGELRFDEQGEILTESKNAPGIAPDISEEAKEALRAMGYLN